MSRDRAWIDTEAMEREDVATLMEDEMIDIKLLRKNELSSNDGFRKQVTDNELELVRVVKGRIDRKQAIYRPQDSEANHVTAQLFIATIYYKDLRVNDVLEVPGQQYRIQYINKAAQSFTEAELEVIV